MQQQPQDMELQSNETEPYDYGYAQTPMTSQSQSQQIDKLVGALAKAQGAIVAPERNRTVTVIPKSGGRSYSFRYATLSAIVEAIRKPFSDNGLWFTQILLHDPTTGFYKLKTALLHASGQFIASEVPIILEGVSTNQQFGSALTYMKRYQLSALIGIAADEDDDGNVADGNEISTMQDRKPAIADSPIQDPKIIKDIVGDIASDAKIKVEFNPEEADEAKAHNWLKFGRDFMASARAAKGLDAIVMLENANDMALRGMEKLAPKVYANMMLALLQVKTELNKKGVENG